MKFKNKLIVKINLRHCMKWFWDSSTRSLLTKIILQKKNVFFITEYYYLKKFWTK